MSVCVFKHLFTTTSKSNTLQKIKNLGVKQKYSISLCFARVTARPLEPHSHPVTRDLRNVTKLNSMLMLRQNRIRAAKIGWSWYHLSNFFFHDTIIIFSSNIQNLTKYYGIHGSVMDEKYGHSQIKVKGSK